MNTIPVIGFAGFSGSGKTTLIEKLIPALAEKGIRTAVIKHDAHGLKFDTEGKDSGRFSAAGAAFSIVNGPGCTAIFISRPLSVEESISLIKDVDLIIIEGYKNGSFPQIGIDRKANRKGLTAPPERFRAIVTDRLTAGCPVPVFGLNDIDSLRDFILDNLNSFVFTADTGCERN